MEKPHSIDDLIEAGELTRARKDVMELLEQPIPVAEGMTASEALEELRDLEW